ATHPQADRSQLNHQYFERYDDLLTLPSQALVELLMEKERKAQMLAGLIGTAISQPKTQSNQNFHGPVGNVAGNNQGEMENTQHNHPDEE
ncbi:MAG: hypothetical protein AAGD09_18180, partial [Cyanobacteria bacterium P01_F01_bin.56]